MPICVALSKTWQADCSIYWAKGLLVIPQSHLIKFWLSPLGSQLPYHSSISVLWLADAVHEVYNALLSLVRIILVSKPLLRPRCHQVLQYRSTKTGLWYNCTAVHMFQASAYATSLNRITVARSIWLQKCVMDETMAYFSHPANGWCMDQGLEWIRDIQN